MVEKYPKETLKIAFVSNPYKAKVYNNCGNLNETNRV